MCVYIQEYILFPKSVAVHTESAGLSGQVLMQSLHQASL